MNDSAAAKSSTAGNSSIQAASVPGSDDKDAPLFADIRLLGRLLGDVIRDQEGSAVFELIERIRQLSIRLHRNEDAEARQELEGLLNNLTREQTNLVVRAFSYPKNLSWC